ncbi:MAG: choice-of-anchor J domain-containing protein [Bacteroidales bacterium]|nr:choice-of-anchor J domain-containing protein [Bacteroidales bacterium]
MKKFLSLVLLMALMFPFAARADEVTIGTAMDASYTHPFALDYKNSWTEAIYYSHEIGGGGLITEISFYCTNAQARSCQDLRIYMGVSEKGSQTSTTGWLPESELTLVYQGPSDLTLGQEVGWQTFELDEPFVYDGADNLIVAVGRVSDNYTYSQKWAYTWTDNTVLYRQNDYNSAYGYHPGNGSGYKSSKRANIKLELGSLDGYCGKVKSVVIDEYTSNSVKVSIVPREGQVAWDYFIATADVTPDEFTVPTASDVTDTTYTFTGLAGATEYNVWVRGNCGDNASDWRSKGVFTFPEWEGDGSEENPYLFYSVKDILDLNQLMKRGWSTEGIHFSQMNNIEDLNVAICPPGTSFKGVWDGNGYSVDMNISGSGYQGLFASLSAGSIVRNVTTTGKIISNNQYNGGIVGCMYNDALISNCVNYATIQSTSGCTAGIAGYVQSNSLVENCVNYGDIVGYGNWHGGIAGYMNNTGYVKNCTNYGTVQGYQYTGGISSECVNYSVIIDCANFGDVDASGAYIGGVTGHVNKSHIYNSYNVGNVKGSHNTGGITGYFQSNDTIHGRIENVYNGGTVVGTNGWLTNTGSLIGYNPSGTMRHAYYLEGTHELAYGTSCNTTRLFDAISFTAGDAENEFVLSEEHYGTTDLLTALNAYEAYGENEWKKDIYGNNKNMPTFNVGNAPGLDVYPSTIAMGFRPIGAEMAPVKVTLTNTSVNALTLSYIEFGSSFFMLDENSNNPEMPLTIEARESVDIYVTTNPDAEVAEGMIEEQMAILWGQRGLSVTDITARAYNPVAPDVVEAYGTIASFPASVTASTQDVKANYQLPGDGIAGADAVYKITITDDVLLNAEVSGDNPKVAIYTEDLYGEAYPSDDNYYTGPIVNETAGTQFYFDQAQFITHPGGGLNGADISVCGNYMGWSVDRSYSYTMADDFYSEEDIVINEVEFYAYQTNALTTSTMRALYVQIYDGNPMEGGQVIWGDLETNILTHSSWTGVYRVSPNFETDSEYPIMRVVASGLNIELPAGTYWIEYSVLGNENFGYAYGIPRTIWGATETGNGLIYEGYYGVWSEMVDTYPQGVPMILRSGFTQRDGEVAKSVELPKATGAAPEIAHRSATEVDYADRLRSGALSTGGTNPIANMTMIPGTYYLVASSTSSEFTVNVNTETIPLPEQATAVYPADGAKDVKAPMTLKWNLGRYTTEYQVLFGTTYPPTEVVQDWSAELVSGMNIFNLADNTNYFWQVNERNASGITAGPVWGFVTSLDVPQDVAVEKANIYAGESAIVTWTSVPTDRTYRGYNVYNNGVKVNNALITDSSYEVKDLTYNMEPGYCFTVTAVYDEGESAFSDPVFVKVTDNGSFAGFVYELDGVTPIADASVMAIGRDEHNRQHLYEYVTDASGYYGGDVLAGSYKVLVSKEGYQKGSYYNAEAQSEYFAVAFDQMTENINVILTETYNPLCEVKAEETEDSNVNVYWSWNKMIPETMMADFETGDFSQANFNNEVTPNYPWVITEEAYEGSYAIKSSCAGVTSGESSIEATVEVPYDGMVSFYHKVSSESGWDMAYFYIDGELKGSYSGEMDWKQVQFPVSAGTHTYKWMYLKDSSYDNGEDTYYVDNIVFYQEIPPFEGGWLYYDDGTYASSIGLGSASPMYWGISYPDAQRYAGFTLTKVSLFDAAPDYAGNYTINIYLGGTSSPGTLVSTQEVALTGIADFVEVELNTPVAIDGTQPLWITFYTADITYPAAGCAYMGDSNSDWLSLDGSYWEHAYDYGLTYTWMARGYLENAKGEVRELSRASEAPKFVGGTSTGEFVAKAAAQPINVGVPSNETMADDMSREMKSYKVYRANNLNNEYTVETVQLLGDNVLDTFLLDTEWATLETGVYKWGVSAVYEGNRKANERTIELDKDFVAYPDATLPCNAEVEIANIDGTMFRGARAYANNLYANNMPLGYLSLDIEKPLEAVTINSTVVDRAGEYYDGMFYGYSSSNKYYKIVAETGEIVSETPVARYMTEMAYDYSTSTMYGIYSGDLYTINIETGESTFIGELGQTIMAFAIDLAGNAYGIAIGYGDLYAINLYDATCEYIGSTNMGCNYVQCAGFDHNDGTLYWFQFYSTDDMGLYKVDVTTAEAEMISLNTGEITSFFIPYEEGDPTYPFQANNESPIVWSNTIDKNMVTSVSVTAVTNSEDPADNTLVTFRNISEPEMGYDYEVTLDETGYYEWPEFRKGTYELTITKSGFASDAMGEIVEIWDVTAINCQLTEIIAPVAGLYVSPTGWAMWIESGTSVIGDEFEYGFEGSPEGWSFIDANADGHTWYHNSVSTQHGVTSIASHTGSGHMYSESFCNIIATPIAPDDYLVSPVKAFIGSSSVFSFWACAQDENFPYEHFGVAISTTGNTSADDFTTISEWTLTAKGTPNPKAGRDASGRGEGSWYKFSVDLKDYAGQEVWLAIRHFNSCDQYVILVDDVTLQNTRDAKSVGFYQISLNGVPEDEVTVPYYQHENLIIGEQYTTAVTTYYTTGVSEESTYTWTYAGCNQYPGVTEFAGEYNDGTVVLNWTLPAAGNDDDDDNDDDNDDPVAMSWDFEDGTLGGWTTIDADGDGNNWLNSNEVLGQGNGYNGSNYFAMSESYINYVGPLNPDNYLVSPEKISVSAGTKISFWACAQDENYPFEHFGVAVSTAGNSSASDFTTISEWTINAKGSRQGERSLRQSAWTQYEADLSEYAGQEVYVALRHFNCTDQYFLDVDDIAITSSKETREGTWAYYDDGINVDAIGGPASFSWAIKLRADDIANLGALTKVAAYDRLSTSGTFDICLGGDNEPGASVLNQEYTFTGINDFVEIELTEAVNPAGQNVWIVFNTDDGINYPAAECANTGDPDGRWIYLASDGWFDVTEAGLDATWMIRGYFDTEAGDDNNEGGEAIAEILGVMLYRDGELLTPQPLTETSFTETVEDNNEYEYDLRVVYGGVKDSTYYAMSCPETVTIDAVMACDAPENLYGEATFNADGTFGATLVWPYSEPASDWLFYDDGNFVDGIGGPASFYWGIMIPAESLTSYAGTYMTKVALFDYAASSGDINIYYGGTSAPATLVHSQAYSVSGTNNYVEFELTSALPIDETQNLWIVFSTSQGASYPAAVANDCGDPNSRWISMDGAVWEDLAGSGLVYSWMIRAYVTNEFKSEVSELTPITDYEYTVGEGELAKAGAKASTLDHYNVYRGTSSNNFELVGETTEGTYFDELSEEGTYYYQVTAVYVSGNDECESDPANAYDTDEDYVVVNVVSINENGVEGMMVYPNPTTDKVTIEAEAMTRITITNALGQTVYDQEVNSDNKVLDMSQYEGGVYMVRITTENGVAVERLTVVR